MNKDDKEKMWENHKMHTEIYAALYEKYTSQEEKDFYRESIKNHTEYMKSLDK
jgi:hypothetical protein